MTPALLSRPIACKLVARASKRPCVSRVMTTSSASHHRQFGTAPQSQCSRKPAARLNSGSVKLALPAAAAGVGIATQTRHLRQHARRPSSSTTGGGTEDPRKDENGTVVDPQSDGDRAADESEAVVEEVGGNTTCRPSVNDEGLEVEEEKQQQQTFFPWRHESTETARLLEKDDFSGMPNNFRVRFVRRLVACRELNMTALDAIPIPFYARGW